MSIERDLEALLGPKGWIPAQDAKSWQRDWLDQYGEAPLGVARPKATTEVADVVRLCASAGVCVVPQGGNTCLTGAAVLGQSGGVIVSLERMASIGQVDTSSATIIVEAGVVLAKLHKHLEGTGLMFPMHFGAEGSAQIGGLIGTNAGGSHAFRYGMMQDLLLGLEVILPSGEVWNGLRRVQKDNAGYQFRKLFCGAEGTLGVVTRAVLKLSCEPVQRSTALLAVTGVGVATELAKRYRIKAGEFLTAIEFFSDIGLNMAMDTIPDLPFPLTQRAPVYMLVEAGAGSDRIPLKDILTEIMELAVEAGQVLDGVVASSEAQRAALWRLREEQPEGQRRSGAQLKHDISVPPGELEQFLGHASTVCDTLVPGVRINPFGHLGDGNVHYNLSPPSGKSGFLGKEAALAEELGLLATELGGSFAAEHGLGRSKVALADRLRDPVERGLMVRLKKALDPGGIMNPGVVVLQGQERIELQGIKPTVFELSLLPEEHQLP